MATKVKKSFLMYVDMYAPTAALSLEQKGELWDAVFKFHSGEAVIISDPMAQMAFSFFRQVFERDAEEYERRCEKNRENVRKRWEAKDTTAYDRIESNTTVCDGIRHGTKHTDNDNDNDNDNDINIPPILSSLRSESMSPTGDPALSHEKPKRASSSSVSRKPPTMDEVQAYCDERGNGLNAERFCDYYAAQGWRLSNGQPMRDWKAAVRNWEQRAMENPRASKDYASRSRVMTDAEQRQAHNDAVCRQVSMELDAMGGPF